MKGFTDRMEEKDEMSSVLFCFLCCFLFKISHKHPTIKVNLFFLAILA